METRPEIPVVYVRNEFQNGSNVSNSVGVEGHPTKKQESQVSPLYEQSNIKILLINITYISL